MLSVLRVYVQNNSEEDWVPGDTSSSEDYSLVIEGDGSLDLEAVVSPPPSSMN